MTTHAPTSLERAGFIAVALALALTQVTLFGAETIGDIAIILWVIVAIRDRRTGWPAFFLPLLVLAGWTLVSCAFSSDPAESFKRSRQLLLFLTVPATFRLARGSRATTALDVIIGAGALAAMIGIVQYLLLGFDNLDKRPEGSLGHYMTYSGVLMLALGGAVARLIFRRGEWIWPAIAVPALVVALVSTYSRSAYLGAVAAIGLLLVLRQWKLLIALPVAIALVFLLSPASIKARVYSIFDAHDATRRDRIAMLESGEAMIKDHPLVGVGLNMVPVEYIAKYKTPDAVDRAGVVNETRAHLHNVPVQLAAERGLPALAAWLWFVVVAARDLFRLVRRGHATALAATGLAALTAMVVAGMMEHNFGDSEFLILFLGLITLPFAAVQPDSAPPTTT
jgi:O-antigen ligase